MLYLKLCLVDLHATDNFLISFFKNPIHHFLQVRSPSPMTLASIVKTAVHAFWGPSRAEIS